MTKNPFLNALAAILYITAVASLMFFGMQHTKPQNTVIIPIAVLSLFSLSAAAMGYLFLYQPVQLYLDGKKKEATTLFTKTLLIFAIITAVVFTILLSGMFS